MKENFSPEKKCYGSIDWLEKGLTVLSAFTTIGGDQTRAASKTRLAHCSTDPSGSFLQCHRGHFDGQFPFLTFDLQLNRLRSCRSQQPFQLLSFDLFDRYPVDTDNAISYVQSCIERR